MGAVAVAGAASAPGAAGKAARATLASFRRTHEPAALLEARTQLGEDRLRRWTPPPPRHPLMHVYITQRPAYAQHAIMYLSGWARKQERRSAWSSAYRGCQSERSGAKFHLRSHSGVVTSCDV